MNQEHIYLVVAAFGIVALDIIVRLHLARDRRDGFYKSLLDLQSELFPRPAVSKVPQAISPQVDDSLSQALLTYFQQSFTTRQVMTALATSNEGVAGRQLEKQVAEHVAAEWNRDLSINAIRRVVMILMGANLGDLREGKFALTNMGWSLFFKTKNAAGPRWSEARLRTALHAAAN